MAYSPYCVKSSRRGRVAGLTTHGFSGEQPRSADAACGPSGRTRLVMQSNRARVERRVVTSRLIVRCKPMLCRIPSLDDQLDVTVENVQKRDELADALSLVRRIEEPVKLRHRGFQATG
jgi:hypothetical protein